MNRSTYILQIFHNFVLLMSYQKKIIKKNTVR